MFRYTTFINLLRTNFLYRHSTSAWEYSGLITEGIDSTIRFDDEQSSLIKFSSEGTGSSFLYNNTREIPGVRVYQNFSLNKDFDVAFLHILNTIKVASDYDGCIMLSFSFYKGSVDQDWASIAKARVMFLPTPPQAKLNGLNPITTIVLRAEKLKTVSGFTESLDSIKKTLSLLSTNPNSIFTFDTDLKVLVVCLNLTD